MNHVDPSGHLVETIVDIGSVGYSIYAFAKDPSWENAGWLALDVGGAIVPFVPSGTTIKGGGAAVKAIKNSKLVVKITDYASIVKKKVGAVISFKYTLSCVFRKVTLDAPFLSVAGISTIRFVQASSL